MQVFVPVVAILAIYARENGQGMVFGSEAGAPDPDQPPTRPTPGPGKSHESPGSGKPSLKVVK